MVKKSKKFAAKSAPIKKVFRRKNKLLADAKADELEMMLAGHPGDPVLYALPSSEAEVYWLSVEDATGEHPAHTNRCGKWLIFLPVKDVDEVWDKIKSAFGDGKLGSLIKVSTAKKNPNSLDPSKRVICVYTYDANDRVDVMRVRDTLRELGISNKISYKTDHATFKAKYAVSGSKRISLYYD